MKLICVLTTAPTLAVARKLARALIQKKLAACVNLIPAIESHYVWKGKSEKSREVQLLIKTRASLFSAIEIFFKKNHPYEVPELIALPLSQTSRLYGAWVKKNTIH